MKDKIRSKLNQNEQKMSKRLNTTPKVKNVRKGKHNAVKSKFAYECCDICGDEFKFEVKNDKLSMKNPYTWENTVNDRKNSIRTNSHITNTCNAGLNSECNNKKNEYRHKVQDDKPAMQNPNQYTSLVIDHRKYAWTNYHSTEERNDDFKPEKLQQEV